MYIWGPRRFRKQTFFSSAHPMPYGGGQLRTLKVSPPPPQGVSLVKNGNIAPEWRRHFNDMWRLFNEHLEDFDRHKR